MSKDDLQITDSISIDEAVRVMCIMLSWEPSPDNIKKATDKLWRAIKEIIDV